MKTLQPGKKKAWNTNNAKCVKKRTGRTSRSCSKGINDGKISRQKQKCQITPQNRVKRQISFRDRAALPTVWRDSMSSCCNRTQQWYLGSLQPQPAKHTYNHLMRFKVFCTIWKTLHKMCKRETIRDTNFNKEKLRFWPVFTNISTFLTQTQ